MKLSPSDIKWDHTCSICGDKAPGFWRMVGYDEFGETWICPTCWEKHKTDPFFRDAKVFIEHLQTDDGSV